MRLNGQIVWLRGFFSHQLSREEEYSRLDDKTILYGLTIHVSHDITVQGQFASRMVNGHDHF